MFEILEHTADIGIKGFGKNYNEAFAEVAKGMFSILADVNSVKIEKTKTISVKASGIDELLVEFLNELLFVFYTEKILFKKFSISINKEKNSLKCVCKGEKLNKKHELREDVKAATYTGLKVGKENGKFFAQCILDV